jgi:hypothetical protein
MDAVTTREEMDTDLEGDQASPTAVPCLFLYPELEFTVKSNRS